MITNGSCIKIQVHSIMDKHSGLRLLNGDAQSKSSASRMASSHRSPCHKSSSSQTQANDTTKTSDYRPQVLEVDPFLQIQPPGYVMQPQGCYMSLPEPTLEFEPEPAFCDPDVCLALERIKLKPTQIRELVDQLQIGIGKNHYIRVNSPDEMYPQSVYENFLYSDLLNMLLEGCLDVTILHWFAM
ncbi:hypothetical protein Hanom_Chr15g01372701 [Helianthus anomalus]